MLFRSLREKLGDAEWGHLSRAAELIRGSRLLITDRASTRVAQIAADIRRATALARHIPPGRLDPQLRTDLALRLALCQKPVQPPLELKPKG